MRITVCTVATKDKLFQHRERRGKRTPTDGLVRRSLNWLLLFVLVRMAFGHPVSPEHGRRHVERRRRDRSVAHYTA